ncbi:Transposase type 1 [Trinorchestia longiramus]|nr:Transposase type 1 [Trinorchestia longiramus]
MLDKWVPRELNENQKLRRLEVCSMISLRNTNDPFLDRIVTCDEKWVLYDNRKRSRQWLDRDEPPKHFPKPMLHQKKIMVTVWWSAIGVIHYSFLEVNETINAARYCNDLAVMHARLSEKRPALVNRRGPILLHDNVRPHVARMTVQKLTELGYETLPQPPYSPDLSPTDYHLFKRLITFLDGKTFRLVCGSVNGNFSTLFKRVRVVEGKAGPFDLLLCVGDFFSATDNSEWELYKSGSAKVPLPTYVLGPTDEKLKSFYPDIRGCELAANIIYLGPSGIYLTSSKLRIAYLSGSRDASADLCGYNKEQIKQLEAEARQSGTIDILVTSRVPKHISKFATKQADLEKDSCELVSHLALNIQPRYHFSAASELFYERLPYRNHRVLQEAARHVTRFLCLASVNNSHKNRWLYAFSLTPALHCNPTDLVAQPPDVTELPYCAATLSSCIEDGVEMNKYFYGGGAVSSKGNKRSHDEEQEVKRHKGGPPQPTGPCWFCLSSEKVEKHLIVSVGEHCYLALAKGGLVPHHLMLLPIHHYQTSLDLEPAAVEELQKFKVAVQEMFSASGQWVVFYERNFRTTHMQLHVVPVPSTIAERVAEVFKSAAEEEGLQLEEVPRRTELSAAVRPGQPFLLVQPPRGSSLLIKIRSGYNMLFDSVNIKLLGLQSNSAVRVRGIHEMQQLYHRQHQYGVGLSPQDGIHLASH